MMAMPFMAAGLWDILGLESKQCVIPCSVLDMVGQFFAYDEDQRDHRFRVLDVNNVELANPDDFKLRKRS